MAIDANKNPYDEFAIAGGYSGKVLVSTTQLDDSVFEKSLIFIAVHDDEGAVGVIFNKLKETISTEELIQRFKLKKRFKFNKKYPIYVGGPVDEDKLVVLSSNKFQTEHLGEIAQLVFYSDENIFLEDVAKGKNKSKYVICRGFCGWAPNQLEQEVQENAWLVVEPNFKDIFSHKQEFMWEKYIKKLGIKDFDKLVSYTGIA